MERPCLACHGTGYEPGLHAAGPQVCRFCHGTGVRAETDPEICPVCEGTGFSAEFTEHGAQVCEFCGGTGYVPPEAPPPTHRP